MIATAERAVELELPPKLLPVFSAPRGTLRYRGAYGGRGSAKSVSFAKMAAVFGAIEPLRILCCREFQNSIKESMLEEIASAINSEPWLSAFYEVGESYIRGINGTEFLFKGLRHNISSLKSLAQIDICIVDEAEDVPDVSWRKLIPTIRKAKSEIWVMWNPERDGSPTDKRFRKNKPARSRIVELNYRDNPWFPRELEEERRQDQENYDLDMYRHIWEGDYLKNSDAQVLRGKVLIKEFKPEPHWSGPYQGMDFGFANDPTTAVRVWVHDKTLYVEYEAGKPKLEITDTAEYVKKSIPNFERYVTYADNARPETISHLQKDGLPRVKPCHKWKGSVEDGVMHLRGYRKIVIHPRCEQTIEEARMYKYKVDRLTDEVLPDIVDDYNHYIDAIRYALGRIIKRKRKSARVIGAGASNR